MSTWRKPSTKPDFSTNSIGVLPPIPLILLISCDLDFTTQDLPIIHFFVSGALAKTVSKTAGCQLDCDIVDVGPVKVVGSTFVDDYNHKTPPFTELANGIFGKTKCWTAS